MKTTDTVLNKINRLPKGYVFTYREFIDDVDASFESIIKYLNRLAHSNKIIKLSKGKYYKPEETIFGNMEPKPKQVVKDLLEKNDKVIGYLTGVSIYSEFGLTTQIGFQIQIAHNNSKPPLERKPYKVSFVLQKNKITKENIPLLQLLDCLRLIKKIPDASVVQSAQKLQALLFDLEKVQLQQLIRLSLKYPANTRALLGCLIEEQTSSRSLKESLNPASKYKFNGLNKVFPNTKNWNIL